MELQAFISNSILHIKNSIYEQTPPYFSLQNCEQKNHVKTILFSFHLQRFCYIFFHSGYIVAVFRMKSLMHNFVDSWTLWLFLDRLLWSVIPYLKSIEWDLNWCRKRNEKKLWWGLSRNCVVVIIISYFLLIRILSILLEREKKKNLFT